MEALTWFKSVVEKSCHQMLEAEDFLTLTPLKEFNV